MLKTYLMIEYKVYSSNTENSENGIIRSVIRTQTKHPIGVHKALVAEINFILKS